MNSAPATAPPVTIFGTALDVLTGRRPAATVAMLLFLSVPQVYLLPEGSRDIALSTLLTLVMVPGMMIGAIGTWRRDRPSILRRGLMLVLVALLVLRVAALLWSPSREEGFPHIILLTQFLVTLVLTADLLRDGTDVNRLLARAYWPWIVLLALLILVFRFQPSLEEAFQRSIGGFFAGQNTMSGLFSDFRNNVLSANKSGGVFVNANVAAMFLGVNALTALALSSLNGNRALRVLGIACLLVIPATGSKSASVLAVALPVLALLAARTTHVPAWLRRHAIAVVSAIAVILVSSVVVAVRLGFVEAMGKAFADRTVIWGFGFQSFLDSPLLGLGHGGWEQGFVAYAAEHGLYRGTFPPHNLLLAAWSRTGILGAALTVLFFVVLFRLVARRMSQAQGVAQRRFAAFTGAALLWIFTHGMGENTDVFGDIHFIPIVSLLICWLVLGINGEVGGHGGTPDRRGGPASTVPALGSLYSGTGALAARVPAAFHRKGRTDHE